MNCSVMEILKLVQVLDEVEERRRGFPAVRGFPSSQGRRRCPPILDNSNTSQPFRGDKYGYV